MDFFRDDVWPIFAILLPSIVVMFIFGTLFTIHMRSLSMTYFYYSLIYTVISLIIYLSTTILMIKPSTKPNHYIFFSYLALLPFIPTMCFVLSKIQFVSNLLKTTNFYVYTSIVIVIFALLITLDQFNNTYKHITYTNSSAARRAFVPSNSLITIFGFISYIYCYLYIISESSPIIDKPIWFFAKKAITNKMLIMLYSLIKITAKLLLIISAMYIVVATLASAIDIAISTHGWRINYNYSQLTFNKASIEK